MHHAAGDELAERGIGDLRRHSASHAAGAELAEEAGTKAVPAFSKTYDRFTSISWSFEHSGFWGSLGGFPELPRSCP